MSDADRPELTVLPFDPNLPESRYRVVIPATCQQHRGARGFTNFLVMVRGGEIVLDAHAVGACVIFLDKNGATTLRDTLIKWLG
jgi:hypothetical protein